MLMTAPLPSIGAWYRHTGGDSFEVVAFDEDDGTIEIQYFDGTAYSAIAANAGTVGTNIRA